MTPPLQDPFRSWPRWARVCFALLLTCAAVWETIRPHDPTEPKQGFIITLLVYAALFVLSELLRPKPKLENARPGTNFNFPTAVEGRVLPLVWGRVKIEGPNVVWYGDVLQEAIKVRQKTGLFTSVTQITGYRYHVGMQFGICRGPIDGVRRVWIGEDLVYDGGLATASIDIDEPELFGGADLGNGGVQATLDIFRGTSTQAVSDYLAKFQDSGAGTTRTPRYIGTAYLVFRELGATAANAIGGYIGNSTSIEPFAFEVERYPALFAGQIGSENKIGVDANPINVIYELLTNQEWGFGFAASDVDVGDGSSFLSASDTLITESSGFSMILDQVTEAKDFLREVERQIDGVVFLDQKTGKWKVKLARADYDIDTVPQLTSANVQEIRDFTRGSWEDTTNQITVKFAHRDNDYKETYALAQDMANAQILGGGTLSSVIVQSAEEVYPGVKDKQVAANIAWRDLRAQSYPLARATFVVNREFYDVNVADVVAWTDAEFGFTKLPMRVLDINYGRLDSNQIVLSCVQDIFGFETAAYGAPPSSLWNPPATSLTAYTANTLAIEAPRAIVLRDPNFAGNILGAKIFCAARRKQNETGFQIRTRYGNPPSGAYSTTGTVLAFMRVGELKNNVASAQAHNATTGVGNITIVADPDTQLALQSQFNAVTLEDMGQDLAHLIMVGNEFMFVQSASNSGADVLLENVFRGVLDSAQEPHTAGDPVYLLFVGAGLGDSIFPNSVITVDVELRMTGLTGTYEGSVTPISIATSQRAGRPYSPAAIRYNSSGTPFTTPSLEGAGSGLNGFRIDVDWWRRRHDTTDEIASLLADDPAVPTGHEVRLEVRADPFGANTLVTLVAPNGDWTSGTGTLQVQRTAIITAAAAGTLLRFKLRSRHDEVYADIESRYDLVHDVTPTSSLTGQFYLGGGVNDNTPTNSYTAAATGTFTVNIGAADAANIEYSLNGGAFTNVITAGGTSGTFSATSGDGIRFRRLTGGSPDPQFIELQNPSSVSVAYGTFD